MGVISLDYIAENVRTVKERVSKAAARVGKSLQDITIVAASKTFGIDCITRAFEEGITHFGESYAQEATKKIKQATISPIWHFIGHLQKNKVRQVLGHFDVIQSVDSTELLERIDRIAGEECKTPELLIQVNPEGEKQKSGIEPEQVYHIVTLASRMKNIKIVGLMMIPPFYDNPEMNRRNFRMLYGLYNQIKAEKIPGVKFKYLSMGMTDDYEIAIEEGATMVRIGRAIFGVRRSE